MCSHLVLKKNLHFLCNCISIIERLGSIMKSKRSVPDKNKNIRVVFHKMLSEKYMKLKSVALFPLSLMSMGISVGLHAQEQDTNHNGSQELEVIEVKANKRVERLQDVPSSINVVTGETIEKLNLTSFKDLEQLSPGLNLTSSEPTTNAVTLRGIGYNPGSSTSPTVEIYLNETVLDTNSAFKSMYDIGQIEVLRGPQGTLRGRTSPSGAITISSKKADLSFSEGYFQQTLSTENSINTQGAFSMPIIDDVLAVRFAGLYDENRGIGTRNITNDEEDSDKTKSFRTSISYSPIDEVRIDLTYQYLKNDATVTPLLFSIEDSESTPVLTADERLGKSTKPGQFSYNGNITTLEVDWDLDELSLTYLGGYQDIAVGRTTDIAYGGSIPDYSQDQSFASSTKRLTNEIRLMSQGENTWDYLFGAYYEHVKGGTDLTQTIFLPFGFVNGNAPPLDISILDLAIDIPNESKNYALFTDHRFKVSDAGQLQIGLRYQNMQIERDFVNTISGVLLGPEPQVSSSISPDNRDVSYSEFSGALSYRHQFSRDLTGYISYGRAFRPGGVIATAAMLDEDLLVFEDETSDNYEVGLKGSMLERSVNFGVSIYQQDFNNYQAYTSSYLSVSTAADGVVDNNVAFTFNADARVRGIEANISSWLTNSFYISLSGTFNDSEFLGGEAPCNDFNGDGIADSDGMPSVPLGKQLAFCKLTGTTSAQADWNISTVAEYITEFAGGELFARVLLDYSPERNDPFVKVDYDNLFKNNFFIGYRDGYEITLFVKNITNDSTIVTRNASQVDYNFFNSGYAVGTTVKPREFGVVYNVKF